jgi:hypothetical protein
MIILSLSMLTKDWAICCPVRTVCERCSRPPEGQENIRPTLRWRSSSCSNQHWISDQKLVPQTCHLWSNQKRRTVHQKVAQWKWRSIWILLPDVQNPQTRPHHETSLLRLL